MGQERIQCAGDDMTTVVEFSQFLADNGWPKSEITFTGPPGRPTTCTRFYTGRYGTASRFAMLDKNGKESQVAYTVTPNSLYKQPANAERKP